VTGDPGAWQRRSADALAAAAGLVVLAAGVMAVRDGAVPAWERSAFEAVNGLPAWLYPLLWPFQQLGVVIWGPVLALGAAIARRYRLAWALVAATIAKLVLERVVKAAVTRERPGTSIGPDAELRGDVDVAGESFVSGHAVMVAAIACLVVPYVPRRWRPLAGARRGRDGRPGLRRRPQPPRRGVRRRPRRGDRLVPQPGVRRAGGRGRYGTPGRLPVRLIGESSP
jgi:membrane-associated phospholipid phosphatase